MEHQRRLVTQIPGPASVELLHRCDSVVARGVRTRLPVFITDAEGAIVRDADGNQLIDFGSGIAVTSVGHAAPRVTQRVVEQAVRFTHTCFMVTPYAGYVEVCEELARRTPGDHEKRSVLFSSGAEAVENAVKAARHATRRPAVIAFDHAYHGRTNLTMALTAKNMPYKDRFGPFAGEIYRMPMAYPLRWPGGPDACARDALDLVIAQIEILVGTGNVAAMIIEPIQGEGGFIVPPPGFLPGLREYCRDHSIVFIADEIQTGFCRTGDWFACDHEAVVPDLVATAKGIAGGLPLAAVTGRAELMDAVHSGGFGGTYGGNPIACAAALGAIETMATDDLAAKARRIEQVMAPALCKLAAEHPVIAEVRGRGAMLAIELNRTGSLDPDAARAAAVAAACHRAGLIVLTCGTFGNVLRFLPPLVISEDLLAEGLDILAAAFADTAVLLNQARSKQMDECGSWPHHELGTELSNWGRWGDDDEIGTLNFITAEKRVRSAKLVVTGKLFDLGMPFDRNGPFPVDGFRINPVHVMTMLPSDTASARDGRILADDMVTMGLQSATQWDALAHVGYGGLFYNNVPAEAVNNFTGAARNSFDKAVGRLISRGVLLDIARLKAVDRLGDSYEITAADLSAAEESQGVHVESGDILLIRTGWYKYFQEGDREHYMGNAPGPGLDTCRWLHDREIAALAIDQWSGEVWPSPIAGARIPFHQVVIRDMGLTIGEMFNLEELADDCEQDGVWESFFCGPGLKVTGSVGSPITPITLK